MKQSRGVTGYAWTVFVPLSFGFYDKVPHFQHKSRRNLSTQVGMPKLWVISSDQNKVPTDVYSFGRSSGMIHALLPWASSDCQHPLTNAVPLYRVFASALFSVYEVCLSPLLRTVLPRSVSWISSAKTPYKSTFSVPWYGLVSSESPSSAYYSMLRVNSYYIAMPRLGKTYYWVTKKWKNNNSKEGSKSL